MEIWLLKKMVSKKKKTSSEIVQKVKFRKSLYSKWVPAKLIAEA